MRVLQDKMTTLHSMNVDNIPFVLEENKKKYNAMESVLQEIQKAISLPNSEKSAYINIMNKIIDQLIEEMKQVDPLFKTLYNKNLYGGSYYDGLKLHSPDEFDLDLALKLPKKMESSLQTCEIPGFVRIRINLERMKQEANYSDYRKMEKFLDSNNYLLTNKFREWFEGVFNKAKTRYQANNQNEFILQTSKSGPAMTLKIVISGKTVCIDLVPSIIFCSNDWPGPPFRANASVKFQNFLVVPKEPKIPTTSSTFWRLSFQEQERELILGKCGLKDTIRLLKLLRDHQFKETSIASYYIKTVMMLFSDTVDDKYWRNSKSYIFMMGLKYFCELLKQKNIPYYWDKKYNLLTGTSEVTLLNWANRLQNLIKIIEKDLDNTDLRTKVVDMFGAELLKQKSEGGNNKDIVNGTEYPSTLKAEGGDQNENISLNNLEKAVQALNEPPSEKKVASTLSDPPSNGISEDVSSFRHLQSTSEINLFVWKTITEYESVGINVTKKLQRMNSTQAIYAEKLISEILAKGLMNQLSVETNISDITFLQ